MIASMRTKLFVALSWLLLCATPNVVALEAPVETVKRTTERVVERVRNEKEALRADPKKMYGLVSEMIFPHFDFGIMAQWVLGSHWQAAGVAKRDEFVEQFRKLLVRTYAAALLEYSNQTIKYPPSEPAKGATAVVKQEVSVAGSDPLPILYRLHNKTGDWKVFDVSVDGVSLVKTYKASFSSIIKEGGIDSLIQTLSEKNRELN